MERITNVVVVRYLRCRREEWSSLHGFALWASPAVTHGVSPLGTVGEHVEAFRLPPPCISRKSVDAHTTSPPQQHPHRDTLASGGGALCLTAGDARRVNPWKEERENSDAGGVALQAWREHHFLSLRKTSTQERRTSPYFPLPWGCVLRHNKRAS